MTDTLALLDESDSLESLLAVLDEDDDEEDDRPGWTHPIPGDQRLHVLLLLAPIESGPLYTHVVNGYFQPILHARAWPSYLLGSEPVVAELRSYVADHFVDGNYRPMTFEESCDIDIILSSSSLTEGLTVDRGKPNIPLAGWIWVKVNDAPGPGTWLADQGPRYAGGQWPEYYILAWEAMP